MRPSDGPFATAMDHSPSSPRLGPSCSLTILKGSAGSHINAHSPIATRSDGSSPVHALQSRTSSRFGASFASLGQRQAGSARDETVNVHAVTDDGVLLPFIDRPKEVAELLFDTKPNEALMQRLCRIFGGTIDQPTRRGLSEAWDELLEILVATDRPILDDEDWLIRLEMIIMERSAELWAQLQRCLGADCILLGNTTASRYDSWPHSALSDSESVSPGTGPSTPISELDDERSTRVDQNDNSNRHVKASEPLVKLDLHGLHELPQSFYKQPAGQLRRMSMHDDPPTVNLSAPPYSPKDYPHDHDQQDAPSPSGHFPNVDSESSVASAAPLADIQEEPSKGGATFASKVRDRSHSGKFAGLRIHATPHRPYRAHGPSPLSPGLPGTCPLDPSSPLPTGVMSPAAREQRSSSVSGEAASPARPTSFARPRRLSALVPFNNGATAHQRHEHRHHDQQHQPKDGRQAVIKHARARAQTHAPSPIIGTASSGDQHHRQSRRRAMSFARSFADVHPQIGQGVPESGCRGSFAQTAQHPTFGQQKSLSVSAGDAHDDSVPKGLGLLPDGRSQHPAATVGVRGRARAISHASAIKRFELSSCSDRAEDKALSEKGDRSPPIPGLLPDGRTRHPSGSLGSRDLSESIAAFRATMGLSSSPSGGAGAKNLEAKGPEGASQKAAPAIMLDGEASSGPTSDQQQAAKSELARPAAGLALGETSPKSVSHLTVPRAEARPQHLHEVETKAKPSGGSGLALGGGFSLSKSGANFKRPEDVPSRSSFSTKLATPSSYFAGRASDDFFSFRSPPPVHRRPGGFPSLAQEYDSARRSRRATAGSMGSVFSFHSNAVASSPGSSIASLESETLVSPQRNGLQQPLGGTEDKGQPMSPTSRVHDWADRRAMVAGVRTCAPPSSSADETPGRGTPRASMSIGFGSAPSQYPFPATGPVPDASTQALDAPAPDKGTTSRPKLESHRSMPSPLGSLGLLRSHGSAPSSSPRASCFAPRSPSLVFPISSQDTVSRAHELQRKMESPQGEAARRKVEAVCGPEVAAEIVALISTMERRDLPDEGLLEAIGSRLRLVDHEHAKSVGGREQEAADEVLAEEGYEQRWEAFAELCHALGVGQVEISLAKRRCGPAIQLVGKAE